MGLPSQLRGSLLDAPEVAVAWGALNNAVRDGMDRRRFEIATIGAARALRSTYCIAAHSAFLRDVCGDEPTMVVGRSPAEDQRSSLG